MQTESSNFRSNSYGLMCCYFVAILRVSVCACRKKVYYADMCLSLVWVYNGCNPTMTAWDFQFNCKHEDKVIMLPNELWIMTLVEPTYSVQTHTHSSNRVNQECKLTVQLSLKYSLFNIYFYKTLFIGQYHQQFSTMKWNHPKFSGAQSKPSWSVQNDIVHVQ